MSDPPWKCEISSLLESIRDLESFSLMADQGSSVRDLAMTLRDAPTLSVLESSTPHVLELLRNDAFDSLKALTSPSNLAVDLLNQWKEQAQQFRSAVYAIGGGQSRPDLVFDPARYQPRFRRKRTSRKGAVRPLSSRNAPLLKESPQPSDSGPGTGFATTAFALWMTLQECLHAPGDQDPKCASLVNFEEPLRYKPVLKAIFMVTSKHPLYAGEIWRLSTKLMPIYRELEQASKRPDPAEFEQIESMFVEAAEALIEALCKIQAGGKRV